MSYFARFSPIRAYRDLRLFLSYRSAHELWFAIAAIVVTGVIISGFVVDSRMPAPYKREIVYFENWRADRTDAEIIALQKIDQAAREKRKAENDKILAERRAQFKRVDDKLESWGL
jgi:hypothetical protein